MLHPDASIKFLDEVVIAAENRPRHRAFPNLALLQNGDLLVVYGVATDHQRSSNGVLVSVPVVGRRKDLGAPATALRPTLGRHYSTAYGMIRLNDGCLASSLRRPIGVTRASCYPSVGWRAERG